MSKYHIEKITCPSCHHDGNFEVWDSINTVLDPEMKEKLLNQSIFLYTCPNCGETFRLNYPILYHQMEDLVMIYLVPESEVEKTYEIFYEKNALADFRTKKYLNRIVTSANQLVEKIQIFDAGKDDRIMELVKLLATDSILKNDPDKEFDELRFAVDDDGTNILVIINKGEITGAVDIDNMYEFASSHCDDFKDLRDDKDIVINREWILNKLAEAENE
ncbi:MULTISPECIES: CpXC domain-containing protein [Blautia]|uniref:CpXC domain-containing protein n=1 Tax=Blautia TaxID=572511 RepID=UPI00319E1E1E